MKPRIGIVARPSMPEEKPRLFVTEFYRKACIEAGAIPFMILPMQVVDYNSVKYSEINRMSHEEKEMLDSMLNLCDAIIMPGGYKMFEHDFYILEYAIKNDIPMLGICLGMQIMANYGREPDNLKIIVENGKRLNHLETEKKYVHSVTIEKNSIIGNILNVSSMQVNSMHNYEVKSSGIYEISAISEDGVIEAIEYPGCTFNIGVQWHPEIMYSYDEFARKLINRFVDICNAKKMGRNC